MLLYSGTTERQSLRVPASVVPLPLETSLQRVVAVLRLGGSLSRAQIAQRTGLSRGTVTAVVSELVEHGMAGEAAERVRSGTLGRPTALVRLERRAGLAAGIDIGKQHIRVAVADLGHELLAERYLEVAVDLPADEGVDTARRLLEETLAEANADPSQLVGAGVALPGPLHVSSGKLGSSTIMPGWAGVRPRELLEQRLGVSIRVDNDANLGVLAEWTWGAAKGCADIAYLKLATGIGCGLIVNGAPCKGTGGTAGEIGHLQVAAEGPWCRCGKRGCLEAVAGSQAVVESLRPTLGAVSVRDIVERAAAGNPECRRVLHHTGNLVGEAVASMVNLLNPARLVVGGPLAAAGEHLLQPLRQAVSRSAVSSAAADVLVVQSQLAERAEALGGVSLILRDFSLAPRVTHSSGSA